MGTISKELIIYLFKRKLFYLLLAISPKRGWGSLKISNFFLLHDKKLVFYLSNTYNISHGILLINFFWGLNKNYSQQLQLKGMGFKLLKLDLNFFLKLGFSHRIIFLVKDNFNYFYKRRQLLKLESRSLEKLKYIVLGFASLRTLNSYKKKGVYCKGSIFKPKISSKKLKI